MEFWKLLTKTRALDLSGVNMNHPSWLGLDHLRSFLVHDNKTVSSAEKRSIVPCIMRGTLNCSSRGSVRWLRLKFMAKRKRTKPTEVLYRVYEVTNAVSTHLSLTCAHTHMHIHSYRGQRLTSGVFFSFSPLYSFLDIFAIL